MTPEGLIEKALADKVRLYGGFNRRVEWIGRSGCPDNFVCVNGVVAFVECKTEKGRLSSVQQREFKVMKEHGVPVFTVRCLDDIERLFNEHFYS